MTRKKEAERKRDDTEDDDDDGFLGNIFFWVVLFLVVYGLFGGNYWCAKSSVAGRIKAYDTSVKEVLYINRHIFERSEVACMNNENKVVSYWVDCDIIFNCKVFAKSEEQERIEKEASEREAKEAKKKTKKKLFFFF